MEGTSGVIRVYDRFDNGPSCSAGQVFPSPVCPMNLRFEVMKAFLDLALGRNVSFRLVPKGKATKDALARGLADFTAPLKTLEYSALQPNISFTNPLMRKETVVIFKVFGRYDASLTLAELALRPAGLWLLLWATITSAKLFKQIAAREKSRAWATSYQCFKVVAWILIGVALSAISNVLCLLFNVTVLHKHQVASEAGLARAVVDGDFRLCHTSSSLSKHLMSQFAPGERPHYPIHSVENRTEILRKLMRQKKDDRPQLAIITNSMNVLALNAENLSCELEISPLELMPTIMTTSYYRSDLGRIFLNSNELQVLRSEYVRAKHRLHRKKECLSGDGRSDRIPFSRLEGVFKAVMISIAASIMLIVAEKFLFLLLERFKTFKIFQADQKRFVLRKLCGLSPSESFS